MSLKSMLSWIYLHSNSYSATHRLKPLDLEPDIEYYTCAEICHCNWEHSWVKNLWLGTSQTSYLHTSAIYCLKCFTNFLEKAWEMLYWRMRNVFFATQTPLISVYLACRDIQSAWGKQCPSPLEQKVLTHPNFKTGQLLEGKNDLIYLLHT